MSAWHLGWRCHGDQWSRDYGDGWTGYTRVDGLPPRLAYFDAASGAASTLWGPKPMDNERGRAWCDEMWAGIFDAKHARERAEYSAPCAPPPAAPWCASAWERCEDYEAWAATVCWFSVIYDHRLHPHGPPECVRGTAVHEGWWPL